MPNSGSAEPLALYSPMTGFVYIFNLIVGTGALTLPAAFHDAGWLLSTVIIVMLAFMSYLTATFVIESMASANAIIQHRRLQRIKQTSSSSSGTQESNAARHANLSSTPASTTDEDDDESEPLLSDPEVTLITGSSSISNGSRNGEEPEQDRYYNIVEVFEMGKMASLFFNKAGRIAFYLCLTIYLYGDLAIYGAAVAKSLRDVACTYTPANVSKSSSNISENVQCWSNADLTRLDAYRIALAIFVFALGPFAFFNVTKTKYLQLLTTIMRWMAFIAMISLALIRLSKGVVYKPPVSQFSGVPNLFGVCVYSFMCHHSLPSLVTPISRKKHVNSLIGVDYLIILSFYFLLAFTG